VFLVSNNRADTLSNWERQFINDIENFIARIKNNPYKFETADIVFSSEETEYHNNLNALEEEAVKRNRSRETLDSLLTALRDHFDKELNPNNNDAWIQESKKWGDALYRNLIREQYLAMLKASIIGKSLEYRLSNTRLYEAVKPPEYIPVVFTRMTFETVPGNVRHARVNLSFELFNHLAYVNEFKWHHYNETQGVWTSTPDPAEATLLLKWRDRQYLFAEQRLDYLDMSGVTEEKLNTNYPITNRELTYGNEIPGYIRYIRGAWKNRYARPVPADPKKHTLELLYPENIPLINDTSAQPRTAYYRSLMVDDGTSDSSGVTHGVSVVWEPGVARQIDEFTGYVRHQFVGGNNLTVRFDVIIPTTPNEKDATVLRPDERLIGNINSVFDAIDQNRRLQPSNIYMPTSVFVKNPITAMFGAYVFEPGNMPVSQFEAGQSIVSFTMTEATPVLGEGNINRRVTGIEPIDAYRYIEIIESIRHIEIIESTSPVINLKESLIKTTTQLTYDLTSINPAIYHVPTNTEMLIYRSIGQSPFNNLVYSQTESIDRIICWLNNKEKIRSVLIDIPDAVPTAEEFYAILVRYIILRRLDGSPMDITNLPAVLQLLHTQLETSNDDFIIDNFLVPSVSINQLRLITGIYDSSASQREIDLNIHRAGLPPIDHIRAKIAEATRSEPSERAVTENLYPDLNLPTYAELFGWEEVDPLTQVSNTELIRFIPSYAEYGTITTDVGMQYLPGRLISDIVDPDVWFVREIPHEKFEPDNDYIKTDSGSVTHNSNLALTDSGLSQPIMAAVTTEAHQQTVNAGPLTKSVYNYEQKLKELDKPNKRRMLYAYPTFAMEFILEGAIDKPMNVFHRDSEGKRIAPLPLHFEARLINTFPVVKMESYTDCFRPNTMYIDFIARSAALRNESWRFLPPINPTSEDDFTNDESKIISILENYYAIKAKPNLLTNMIFKHGTRVSVRIGYGTDINNESMLPVVTSGVIGETKLGEMSRVVIQDIGMQINNPLHAKIGGGGRYRINRLLNGNYTYRAFIDIFSQLDTRHMGRSGRGLHQDIRNLSTEDIARIYRIGINSRVLTEQILADGIWGNNSDWLAAAVLGALPGLAIKGVTGKSHAAWIFGAIVNERTILGKAYLSKVGQFFPELTNVYPTITGVSDWAISNTSTAGREAAYWIDMIARLNPGCTWWVHPYGNEARLFFGKPDQLYRKTPRFISPATAGIMQSLSHSVLTDSALTDIRTAYDKAYPDDNRVPAANVLNTGGQRFLIRPDVAHMLNSRAINNNPAALDLDNIRKVVWQPEQRLDIYLEILKIALEKLNEVIPRDLAFLTHLLRDLDYAKGALTSVLSDSQGSILSRVEDLQGGREGLALMFERVFEAKTWDEVRPILDLPLPQVETNVVRYSIIVLTRLLKDILPNLEVRSSNIVNSIAMEMLTKARYVSGYRRFRTNHTIVSSRDLLSSHIVTTQSRMANAVSVDGHVVGYSVVPTDRRVVNIDGDIDNLNFGVFQWFKGLVGTNDRDQVLGILVPNALARGLSKMYDGQLVVSGDATIKPNDVAYLMDLHNGYYGPVKVAGVIHSFDRNNGFMSMITPELHTQSFSSQVLSDHVATLRVLRTVGTSLLIGGTLLALTGNPLGVIIGISAGVAAGAVYTYASIYNTFGSDTLTGTSPLDALDARNEDEIDAVMKGLILDTFVSSKSVDVISPHEKLNPAYLVGIKNQETPELGVTMYPLKMIGTYAPLVAGLSMDGIRTVRGISTIGKDALNFALNSVKDIASDVSDTLLGSSAIVSLVVGDKITDAADGYRTIINGIEREAKLRRLAEDAIKSRLDLEELE